MLKFCSLYSGSSGNCLYIESNKSKILIDAGTSLKKIDEGLQQIGKNIEDINAVFVSHEHSDHIQSIGNISKKYNIPVYANLKTWSVLDAQKEKIKLENIKTFENDKDFEFNDLTIHPFSTPHDAINSCGFSIHNGSKQLSIATDLGHINDNILKNIIPSSFILLEANYDQELLKLSRYPYQLKQRIAGPYGHLPNEITGKTISELMKKNLKQVMLGHLSKENNFPELAYQTVVNELITSKSDINNIKISVASRFEPSKIIDI